MGRRLSGLGNALAECLFPSGIYCACCGDLIDPGTPYDLCDVCARAIHWSRAPLCDQCGKELWEDRYGWKSGPLLCGDCRSFPRRFEKGMSCVRYGLLERGMVHQLKYGGKPYLYRSMSAILYDRLMAEELPHAPEWIVPVPMFAEKRRRRGYNQAELLAKGLSERSGIPWRNVLERACETRAMSALTAGERRGNLKNVFTVSKKQIKIIENRTLLLVDDVYTTGSTADECSGALLDGGAQRIYVLTFASGTDRPARG